LSSDTYKLASKNFLETNAQDTGSGTDGNNVCILPTAVGLWHPIKKRN